MRAAEPGELALDFQAELTALCLATRARLGAFCDYEGEAIAVAGPDPDEAKILGAHASIWLLQLQRVARDSGHSERISLRLASDETVILAEALPGGYGVFLTLPANARWPTAVRPLRALADRLLSEI